MKVLVPTFRSFAQQAFRGIGYEAQDVFADVADVDLVQLQPGAWFTVREHVVRFLAWHDFTGLARSVNPGLHTWRVAQEYDLFVLICQHRHLPEVLYLNALTDWSRRCRKKVCILDELWEYEVPRLRPYLKTLKQFDLVLIACEGSVRAVAQNIERPCHFLPPAVDTLRFTPLLRPSPRCIDIYSIGRRQAHLHDALCRLAEKRNLFYLFDRSGGGDSVTPDHRQHRSSLADLARRSRCFMVAPALVDQSQHTRGQIEVPTRYFEGAAAGAILLGQRPACRSFERLFDWPDAVVEVRPDGSDCEEVVWSLLTDTSRCERISHRNATEALLRHDWVYRWKQVLQLLGMPPTEAMLARERRLQEIAHSNGRRSSSDSLGPAIDEVESGSSPLVPRKRQLPD
jgi:hypothetical protein